MSDQEEDFEDEGEEMLEEDEDIEDDENMGEASGDEEDDGEDIFQDNDEPKGTILKRTNSYEVLPQVNAFHSKL
jgi:hypothetical protein